MTISTVDPMRADDHQEAVRSRSSKPMTNSLGIILDQGFFDNENDVMLQHHSGDSVCQLELNMALVNQIR